MPAREFSAQTNAVVSNANQYEFGLFFDFHTGAFAIRMPTYICEGFLNYPEDRGLDISGKPRKLLWRKGK